MNGSPPDLNNPVAMRGNPTAKPLQIPTAKSAETRENPRFPVPLTSRLGALAAVILLFSPAGAAMAQSPEGTGNATSESNPCRVDPDGEQPSPNGTDARPSLEECNGVLVPPVVGDQEIVETPPDTGTTPVIPPGALPEQPAAPEEE